MYVCMFFISIPSRDGILNYYFSIKIKIKIQCVKYFNQDQDQDEPFNLFQFNQDQE